METEDVKVSATVKRAAAELDKVIPGWHQRVNVKKLEMGDCQMCMLGQTFGFDAEMGIAKELYPVEWAKAAEAAAKRAGWSSYDKALANDDIDGYCIGREFFKQRGLFVKRVPEHLEKACGGESNECEWIAEIMDRRAADDARGIPPIPAQKARRKKR